MSNCWFINPQSSCDTFFFIHRSYLGVRRTPFFLYRHRSKLKNFPLRTLTYLPVERAILILTTIDSIKFLPGRITKGHKFLVLCRLQSTHFYLEKGRPEESKYLMSWLKHQVFERTDKDSSIVILKMDRNDKRVIWLNPDKSFMMSIKTPLICLTLIWVKRGRYPFLATLAVVWPIFYHYRWYFFFQLYLRVKFQLILTRVSQKCIEWKATWGLIEVGSKVLCWYRSGIKYWYLAELRCILMLLPVYFLNLETTYQLMT